MPRYVIRVVYPKGVAFLRHGAVTGSGPIVRFRDKKTAEINLEFVQQGLDEGLTASVVRLADSPPRKTRTLGAVDPVEGIEQTSPRATPDPIR